MQENARWGLCTMSAVWQALNACFSSFLPLPLSLCPVTPSLHSSSCYFYYSSPSAAERGDGDGRSQNHFGCIAFKLKSHHLSLTEASYEDQCVGTTALQRNATRHGWFPTKNFPECAARAKQGRAGGDVYLMGMHTSQWISQSSWVTGCPVGC